MTAALRPPRRQLANAIRALSMDAVEAARSGHPGMPMGMADIAEVLWNDFLRHNPANPHWCDRDRFVLSNGHGSMLIYALAHLSGYPLEMEEIRQFRQIGQRTAGHPEREVDIAIETTTGPLGQGLANAVGLALAEQALAATFNRPGGTIVDHFTYVFMGDGCLMEGISHEACSLAGTLGLGKLIGVYDENNVSIDGNIDGWFTDDTPARFRAYGWHVVEDVDGHDPEAVIAALEAARAETSRPSLICCKTLIGWGAPNKQGTADTHGAPLGPDEVAATRTQIGWEYEPFVVPDELRDAWDARARGEALEAEWQQRFDAYAEQWPDLAQEFQRRVQGGLPGNWSDLADAAIREIAAEASDMATRKASLRALEAFAPHLPELIGGSADLTGSNNTLHSGSTVIDTEQAAGNYIYFGVREFAMAAILNGLALHGGFIPYGGTVLVFSDYARNALRMAALMGIRSILVFTHDSIGLGEDGPTHQPIEHLSSLRAMPNMAVWRPCDTVETAVAWRSAVERLDGPTSLVLTRQGLSHVARTDDQIGLIARGGYILLDSDGDPEIILMATGSEVGLVLGAARNLVSEGVRARVVSIPCTEVFDIQPEAYRAHVLPANGAARLAVEAGARDCWWRYIGGRGDVHGMAGFGQSAPGKAVMEHYGFTVEAVTEAARRVLRRNSCL
ncbi:MAG: transketolase [Proteobacteria bacterium]|nr:transketolase [Pseudomonadota bacterium]